MEKTPSTNGNNGLAVARDDKGRFLPGNPGGPGNPNARNVAAWRRALADSVSADDIAQVVRKLKDAALDGEPWAIRELLDRCFGKPHVQVDFQADADHIRQYTEAERAEGHRLAAILIEERLYGVEGAAQRRLLRHSLPEGKTPGAAGASPPPPPAS